MKIAGGNGEVAEISEVTARLLDYVSYDTQSEDDRESIPSTKKQFELAHKLAEPLWCRLFAIMSHNFFSSSTTNNLTLFFSIFLTEILHLLLYNANIEKSIN